MARLIVIQSVLPRAASWSDYAQRGGQIALVIQWLVGLERLGHDVLFINTVAAMQPADESRAAQYFESTMARWWHVDHSALFDPSAQRSVAGRSFR